MKLTKEGQAICDKYSMRDESGRVWCCECPLAVDKRYCVCKANTTEEEWEEYNEEE